MPTLNILLVDDHALFRSGLRYLLLDLDESIEFTEAESCAQALEIGNENSQLILLDYHLPDSNGNFDVLHKIKQQFPAATIVVLSSEDDPTIILGTIDSGAAGFIPKSSNPNIMIAALQLIMAGGVYLPPMAYSSIPDHAPSVINQYNNQEDNQFGQQLLSQLTCRQREALFAAIKGKPNKIIARELNIAEGTVKAHLSVAFRVIGVKNRTEAVYFAAKSKLGL